MPQERLELTVNTKAPPNELVASIPLAPQVTAGAREQKVVQTTSAGEKSTWGSVFALFPNIFLPRGPAKKTAMNEAPVPSIAIFEKAPGLVTMNERGDMLHIFSCSVAEETPRKECKEFVLGVERFLREIPEGPDANSTEKIQRMRRWFISVLQNKTGGVSNAHNIHTTAVLKQAIAIEMCPLCAEVCQAYLSTAESALRKHGNPSVGILTYNRLERCALKLRPIPTTSFTGEVLNEWIEIIVAAKKLTEEHSSAVHD